jgi:hypothetical protein
MPDSIETKIAELERKLALKNAYLGVNISFGKGHKSFSEDVRAEVTKNINEFCRALANDEEISVKQSSLPFSEEDIEILQQLISTVKDRQSKPQPAVKDVEVRVKVEEPKPLKPKTTKKATIMFLDNLSPELKGKVEPQSEVTILSTKGALAFVEDNAARRFNVPFDDLEPIFEEGE